MANKKMSTAELVGISHFSRNGLMTQRYGEVVYFIVQPTNISVLSETSIAIKINHLMQLLSQQPDIEIICSDARENFEFNKLALARKAEKEDNLKVQLGRRILLPPIRYRIMPTEAVGLRQVRQKRRMFHLPCQARSLPEADIPFLGGGFPRHQQVHPISRVTVILQIPPLPCMRCGRVAIQIPIRYGIRGVTGVRSAKPAMQPYPPERHTVRTLTADGNMPTSVSTNGQRTATTEITVLSNTKVTAQRYNMKNIRRYST